VILTWMACANGVGEVRLVGPVGIHYEDIVVPCWTIARRREKDFRAVRRPGRGNIVICVVGDLCLVGPVCVHHENLCFPLRPPCALRREKDFRAVRGPGGFVRSAAAGRDLDLVGPV